MLIGILRLFLFSLMVISFAIGTFLLRRKQRHMPQAAALIETALRASRYSRWGIHLFHIQVRIVGRPSRQPAMVIANHMSYIDPIVMTAANPAVYVTSKETERMPILGGIAAGAGCVFVDRKNARNAAKDMGHLAGLLQAGCPVTVYPEATSTNGSGVKAFHGTLLEAALRADVPIQPGIFHYKTLDRKPVSVANRDRICWYGDMTFFPHFWYVLCQKSLTCTLHWLPLIPTTGHDRKSLAEHSHGIVSDHYTPIR